MQCEEHIAAQRIAIFRVQKPENAQFSPSENRFFPTLPGLRFFSGKDSCFYQYTQIPIVYSFEKMLLNTIYSLEKCSHPLIIHLKKCVGYLFIRS